MTDTTGRYAPMPEQCGSPLNAKYSDQQMHAYADATCALREAHRPQAEDVDDFTRTQEQLAQWLDTKYKRHGEDKDRAAAVMLRQLAHAAQRPAAQDDRAAFERGDIVRKRSGSAWEGRVCGEYSTSLTPEGYAVESDKHPGSVQIYPAAALELIGRGQQAAIASRPVPPPISDERIRTVGAAHYGTLMTEQEMRFARAIIAARDAQWKGGV